MLSVETLYFSSTISRGAILLIFGALLFSQPKARYLRHWSLALLTSGLGTLLSVSYDRTLTLSSLELALFMASLVLSWSGLRLFYGRSVCLPLLPLFAIFPCVIYIFAVQVGMPERVSLSIMYVSAAIPAARSLCEILASRNILLFSQYLVALAFAGYTLILVISGAMILAGLLVADAIGSAYMSLAFDQAASILVYFGYIAMTGERAALELVRQAESDPLTGLTNRRGARRILERLHDGNHAKDYYSVVIGDVDHFKKINDTLGHEAGDAVLVLLAERLTGVLRKCDSAIRWGGEEFLLILPSTDIDEAQQVADRLRRQVSEGCFIVGQEQLVVTLSLGIAERQAVDLTFESILIRADQGLYRAKHEGRNRVSR